VESAALGIETAGWDAGIAERNAKTAAAVDEHSHSGLQDEVVSPAVK